MSDQALRARPMSVGESRRYVRGRLAGVLGPERLAEAELLTSELVTNAVRHAALHDGAFIRVEVEVDPQAVQVSVVDSGSGFDFGKILWKPRDDAGGWGLILVEKLADRWGIDPASPHSVWFQMDR